MYDERLHTIFKLREAIKTLEDKKESLYGQLKVRKEELSKDEILNELNDEYMEVQELIIEKVQDFSSQMDQLVTDVGASANE